MDAEVKSELLEQDKLQEQDGPEPESGGDGMDAVEPDRIGDTDNTKYVYNTNTDISLVGGYGVRLNEETGKDEKVTNIPGQMISEFSHSTSTAQEREKWLNKKYQPKPGIVQPFDAPAPALDDLVTIGEGKVADTVFGTPQKPCLVNSILPNCLFIDGKVDQSDVRQGNLGDCYFLAAVLQVIHYDPDFFTKIMSMHGDEVYVELCHREGDSKTGYKWVRKPIAVKWGENQRGQKSGTLKHIGSHYRVKYDPESDVKWVANFSTDILKFEKTQYYQAAMWVHSLERAYADYSKLYGQEGLGNSGSANKDRYDNIDGGTGYCCIQPLLGDVVKRSGQLKCHTVNNESATRGLIDSSNGLFDSLVNLAQMQDGAGAEHIYIDTYAMQQQLWKRVKFYADRLKTLVTEHMDTLGEGVNPKDYQDAVSVLDKMVTDLDAFIQTNDTDSAVTAYNTVKDSMATLAHNNGFKELGLSDYLSLKASAGTLIERKKENVYILTSHAYNIREIHFVDKDGEAIDLNTLYAYYVNNRLDENYDPNAQEEEEEEELSFWEKLWEKIKTLWKGKKIKVPLHVEYKLNMDKLKAVIDLDKSYVVIQNPHAKTKAVYAGEEEPMQTSGTWTTSLHELFAGVTGYTAVIVKSGEHGETGTADVEAIEGIGGTSTKKEQ